MPNQPDPKFTQAIADFLALEAPTHEQLEEAADLLHRSTRDHGLWVRCHLNPERMASYMQHRLRKILTMRQDGYTNSTAEQFTRATLEAVAKGIDKERRADTSHDGHTPRTTGGRRPDHDQLPADVQALWDECAALWKKIKHYHETIKTLTMACDRYELARPLREAWRKYRKDMNAYDDYVITPKDTDNGNYKPAND